jgi:hypothetical protein
MGRDDRLIGVGGVRALASSSSLELRESIVAWEHCKPSTPVRFRSSPL